MQRFRNHRLLGQRRLDLPHFAACSARFVLLGTLALGISAGPASAQFARSEDKAGSESRKGREVPDIIGHWETGPDGKEYRVVKLHKPSRVEGRDWARLSENTLRGHMGIPIEIFKEDDEYFWVREVKPEAFQVVGPHETTSPFPAPPPEPEPADWRLAFESRSVGLPSSAQWRNGFVFADMNGDGLLDLVHGPARKDTPKPHVFLQQKDGSWIDWPLTLPELDFDYGDVEVADYNNDGQLDIALGMHLRGGTVLLGDGKGTFRLGGDGISYRKKLNDQAWTGRALTSGDFDGDGDTDLAYIGEGMEPPGKRQKDTRTMSGANGMMLYMNEGKKQGAEVSWKPVLLRSEANGDAIEVGDIEGDGQLEIAHANNVSRGPTVLWKLDPESKSYVAEELHSLLPASITRAVAFADLDGIPGDELITAGLSRDAEGWSLDIRWHKKGADGIWVGTEIYRSPRTTTPYGLAVGDLDGDSVADIVATTDDAELLMFRGLGEGRFTLLENNLTERTYTCSGRAVELQDLDGDGRDEVAVTFSGEGAVLIGIGNFPGCENQGSIRIWSPGALTRTADAAHASDPSE